MDDTTTHSLTLSFRSASLQLIFAFDNLMQVSNPALVRSAPSSWVVGDNEPGPGPGRPRPWPALRASEVKSRSMKFDHM